MRVSLLLRNGMKQTLLRFRLPSAFMQFASANKLRLMLAPSLNCCPWLLVSDARSAPARSTNASLPITICLR
jgi:hypothetical protein